MFIHTLARIMRHSPKEEEQVSYKTVQEKLYNYTKSRTTKIDRKVNDNQRFSLVDENKQRKHKTLHKNKQIKYPYT